MKLFRYEPRTEGQVPPMDAIIVFGKKYDYPDKRNGWYLIISLPFLTRHIPDYLDPRTFEINPTTCFWRYFAMCRRFQGNGKYTVLGSHVWCPTEFLEKK